MGSAAPRIAAGSGGSSSSESQKTSRVTSCARRTVLWLHRWVGLAMAIILLVEGVTGSLLAFRADLMTCRLSSDQGLLEIRPFGVGF